MGEMTFIVEYDFIKVGSSSFSYVFENLEYFYFRMSIEHRFYQTHLHCTPLKKRTQVWFELEGEISFAHEFLMKMLLENVQIKK